MAKRLDLKDVNIYYGSFQAVADVSLTVLPRSVTAFIGPSGCGKTTVLRTLNRMHEVIPGARMQGMVLLDDDDHTYDYVIEMLQAVFSLPYATALAHTTRPVPGRAYR